MRVLAYCNELGLIGGETFAIDVLWLPSNASIEMSGKKEQLEKRLALYRKMAEKQIAKHKHQDEQETTGASAKERYLKRQHCLNRQIEKLSDFLETM